MIVRSTWLLLLVIASQFAFAQTDKEKAFEKARAAVKLMDNGKFEECFPLLEEAQKLDPENINYPYEMAYAWYAMKDYEKASKQLESLLSRKNVMDKVYQLLGNSYDNLGKGDKAIETYSAGLKLFPKSGPLHLESGVMQLGKKDYDKAINYFEKGIEVDPTFASNYYWAAKLYCSSTEEVWGMIYGELFMNMERNSRRTAEISKLLFDTYKEAITITSDSSLTVSFSKNNIIDANDLKDPSKLKLPFGMGVYEPTLIMSMLFVKKIDLNTLSDIRSKFVDNYFGKGLNKTHPNLLFDYQKRVKDEGHMDAYNHWILLKGDEEAFEKWQADNRVKWDNFIKWFTDNKLKVDEANRFYRGQY